MSEKATLRKGYFDCIYCVVDLVLLSSQVFCSLSINFVIKRILPNLALLEATSINLCCVSALLFHHSKETVYNNTSSTITLTSSSSYFYTLKYVHFQWSSRWVSGRIRQRFYALGSDQMLFNASDPSQSLPFLHAIIQEHTVHTSGSQNQLM